MVKTHQNSIFGLKSLTDIRNSSEIILQIEKTESVFSESKLPIYLCESVPVYKYVGTATVESLAKEVLSLNEEIRKLRKKIEKLQKG